jgi:alanine racemase
MAAAGTLTIDLDALRANYRAVRAAAAPAAAGAVVKADAYGLGAERLAPVLYDEGCRHFFVAQLGEALTLRPLLPKDARLFVMNGLQPGTERACAEAGIVPMLNSLEQIANWSALGVAGAPLEAVLQFDSGMSRLGMSPEEARRLAAEPVLLAGVTPLYAMSHLASADTPEESQNAAQLAEMRTVRAMFPGLPLCLANSGGIFLGAEFHGALVRPGVALYGGVPNRPAMHAISPVIRLDVPVIQTRTVPAGTRIGYGGDFVAPAEMRLAAIEAGYADGLPRHLGNNGAAFFGDVRLPMVGRVSMDSVVIDISALPPGTLHLGHWVELIGPHQSLDAFAAAADTIAYEILTRLGRRYQRIYKEQP